MDMVGVAQLVEPQVVALVVVGSSPITHPIKNCRPLQHTISAMVFFLIKPSGIREATTAKLW